MKELSGGCTIGDNGTLQGQKASGFDPFGGGTPTTSLTPTIEPGARARKGKKGKKKPYQGS